MRLEKEVKERLRFEKEVTSELDQRMRIKSEDGSFSNAQLVLQSKHKHTCDITYTNTHEITYTHIRTRID